VVDAMAQKADSESKPNETADPSAGDLPLEDPRWILLIPEYKRLAERLAGYQLATLDFTKAMVDGDVRCMRRLVDDGVRERLPPGIWATLYLGPDLSSGSVMIFPRKISDRNVSGLVYYVWKPDIDKLWLRFEPPPTDEPKVEQDAENTSSQGIPGRRATRDWPIVVAVEVVRLARAGAVERPTSTAMIKHCQDKINFSPKPEPMRLLLKRLWPQ
jgi:hypothetical protein